ncbi:RagB/SusD family nutrient uptake outer membrane protein [Pedobacter hiemivivus]|uniref:RagB/SusD family nutrient uptake outer membrane protein n=1 Tax=Pedobacter hiemivivus TaxID=2530454 RepID=A0A4R0NA53_9SPHI|nr:RagB/SusD family nutrient uptake outer membrane protein [Pedobacter hiemivivus]TCC95752.1 RagB/SusD family nutrient uptake outer membrane protein [Pedobacter hiemivivus]
MKNNIFLFTSLTALSLLFVSCGKFLDVEPKKSTSDEVTIVDENSAKTAVRGIYNQLQSDGYYGYSFQILGFFSGDNIRYTGSQTVNNQLTNHNVKSDLAVLATSWTAIYNTINRANNVIAKVPQLATTATFTPAIKNQLIGEAYFIRALAYFDLTRTWGGVQLILTPTTSPNDRPSIQRSSVAETYAQVLKDLIAAEDLLPETTNRIRATKKTVWALKARFYLYQNNWPEAEKYAGKIIDDKTNYTLLNPYKSFFANNASATSESVLELYYNINVTNTQAYNWQPSAKGGVGWIRPTDKIAELLSDPAIGGDRKALVEKQVINGADNWFGNLYYRTNGTDPAFLIRLAELYLIRAEARAQQENPDGARDDLNEIRKRSNVGILTTGTKEQVLLAIENENRLEFALENHRWYDLIRTNRAKDVLGIADANKLRLPIPYSQTLIDPNLAPNPGYSSN